MPRHETLQQRFVARHGADPLLGTACRGRRRGSCRAHPDSAPRTTRPRHTRSGLARALGDAIFSVVPVVLALAQAAHMDPVKPAIAATVGCSFGFMLPVSTPPNALVYATGHVRIRDMVRYGILLDLAGVLLISLWVAYCS
jgi:hypothetical protein